MSSRIAMAAILAAALATPLTLTAQQPASPPTPPAAAVAELQRELEQVKAQLEPLRQQALQNEELRQEQEAIDAAIRSAIIAADPANEARLQRAEAITTELKEAEAANAADKVSALKAEQETLLPQLDAARRTALEQTELNTRWTAFQSKLSEAMVGIDANARQLLDRKQALKDQIGKASGGAR